ncbi:growth-regulating factor 3-like [Impatiens glandulifera]|uniref:growth-regulating factor 3-like n=1 Tax=Impatiens glandulifera TaxID=253017 RepID=UPI001FB09D3E|nr:growth-regulating factor 3-like [Impatiens glandulifera]
MSGTRSSFTEVGRMRFQPPFTPSQLQELEHQALIYKYMVAGAPVSSELLIPILQSLDSSSPRFFHHSSVGYSSNFGKKLDPDLGRCKRTDGKKWRCSKDATPDSKYCERHMNKGRNRSRKLVESQTNFKSPPTVVSSYGGSNVGSSSFQNLLGSSIVNNEDDSLYRSNVLKLQMECLAYDTTDKEQRYLHGEELLPDAFKNTSSVVDSGNPRVHSLDSNFDNTWNLMPFSNMSPQSNPGNIVSNLKEEDEHHGMRTFLDNNCLPTSTKGLLWPNFENTFSNTQLSISTPVASPEPSSPYNDADA